MVKAKDNSSCPCSNKMVKQLNRQLTKNIIYQQYVVEEMQKKKPQGTRIPNKSSEKDDKDKNIIDK